MASTLTTVTIAVFDTPVCACSHPVAFGERAADSRGFDPRGRTLFAVLLRRLEQVARAAGEQRWHDYPRLAKARTTRLRAAAILSRNITNLAASIYASNRSSPSPLSFTPQPTPLAVCTVRLWSQGQPPLAAELACCEFPTFIPRHRRHAQQRPAGDEDR